MKNKKGAMEFSFGWIFAIIAGIFILSLAIYGVIKFINLERASQDAQTAKDIGVLMNPLESSFESIKRTMITTPAQTRIYTGCSNETFFGTQTIRVSQSTYGEWSEDGTNIYFQNKYVFSENPVEGRSFYLFSMPFKLPFKVGDLIYLTSTKDKYCFIDSPKNIEEEIKALRGLEESKNENLFLEDDSENCPEGSINVCFNSISGCKIKVFDNYKYVEKNGKRMYYQDDALMYAAIFSNKEDYECQIDRLMKRTEQLAQIYEDKSKFIFTKTTCDSGLSVSLIQLANSARAVVNSDSIGVIYSLADDIDRQNDYSECNLW
jgi:hypothetical protein